MQTQDMTALLGQALSGMQPIAAPHVQVPQVGTPPVPGMQQAQDPMMAMQLMQILAALQANKQGQASAPPVLAGR